MYNMLSKPILISACVFSLLFGMSVRGVNHRRAAKSPVKVETGSTASAPVQVTDNQKDVQSTPQVQTGNTASSPVPASLIGKWEHRNPSDVSADDTYYFYPSGRLLRIFSKARETGSVYQTCALIDQFNIGARFTVSESNVNIIYKTSNKELLTTCGMAPGAIKVENKSYSGQNLNYSMALQNNGRILVLTPGNGNNMDNSVKTYQKSSDSITDDGTW